MSKRILLVVHDGRAPEDRAARHLRALGHEVDWTCPATGGELPRPDGDCDAAIVYGGLQPVNSKDRNAYLARELDWIGQWVDRGKPLIGICLGSQLLAHSLGARVGPHPQGLHEFGYVEVSPTEAGRAVLPGPLHFYQAHHEGFDLPRGAELLARSASYPHQAFRYGRAAYGFQFHPEVTRSIMLRWLESSDSERMAKPGVHGRERQIADDERYGETMAVWFNGFLERWLEGK